MQRATRGIVVVYGLVRNLWWTDVLTLHVTTPSLPVLGVLVVMVGRLASKPVVVRKFAGPSHRQIEHQRQPCGRSRLAVNRWVLRRADLYLAETWPAVEAAREDGARADRYPNNRPLALAVDGRAEGGACRRYVFVSHVRPAKGISELVKAGEQLPHDASVDVYGPLRGGMTEQDFAGLQRVCYRGVLTPDQVIPTLAEYDALLLPTYHEGEGQPGILLEAFLAGIPVIATRWHEVPEVVKDTCGILVEPRDAESLRTAMQRLYDDEDVYRRLSEGARQRSRTFATERWAEYFARCCCKLTARKCRST